MSARTDLSDGSSTGSLLLRLVRVRKVALRLSSDPGSLAEDSSQSTTLCPDGEIATMAAFPSAFDWSDATTRQSVTSIQAITEQLRSLSAMPAGTGSFAAAATRAAEGLSPPGTVQCPLFSPILIWYSIR